MKEIKSFDDLPLDIQARIKEATPAEFAAAIAMGRTYVDKAWELKILSKMNSAQACLDTGKYLDAECKTESARTAFLVLCCRLGAQSLGEAAYTVEYLHNIYDITLKYAKEYYDKKDSEMRNTLNTAE